ncbi:MAG: gfo/Idh/MocA family oxidoreductase, partial [Gemmatimonadota bacterium]
CHDLDWLRHVMGEPCQAIQSFGSLKHFRASEKPAGAADRCLDCRVEAECPYSARRIYISRVEKGHTGWPVDVLTPDTTVTGVMEALRTGPYGRCVYACDNDVVDNQVVNILFAGGKTASFCMEGLSEGGHRRTCLFGTRGQIHGDGRYLKRFDFLTEQTETIDTEAADSSILGGHGGGDYGLMSSFVDAVAHGDQSRVLSGPAETLETHLMVFAAERSRRDGTVVTL